jgi:hypothetical protein
LAAVKRLISLGVVLFMAACSTHVATTTGPTLEPPNLSRAQVEELMLRADDLRRLALDFPGTANLSSAFDGLALQRLRDQSQSLSTRGIRRQEQPSSRNLVFWDPLAHEAVLQVVAEQRSVSADEPNPAWSSTVRQWWARLHYVGGGWMVVEEEDLPPDRWRADDTAVLM